MKIIKIEDYLHKMFVVYVGHAPVDVIKLYIDDIVDKMKNEKDKD